MQSCKLRVGLSNLCQAVSARHSCKWLVTTKATATVSVRPGHASAKDSLRSEGTVSAWRSEVSDQEGLPEAARLTHWRGGRVRSNVHRRAA